jgi:hypothetical protein
VADTNKNEQGPTMVGAAAQSTLFGAGLMGIEVTQNLQGGGCPSTGSASALLLQCCTAMHTVIIGLKQQDTFIEFLFKEELWNLVHTPAKRLSCLATL